MANQIMEHLIIIQSGEFEIQTAYYNGNASEHSSIIL